MRVPVGLLGLAINTNLVFSVIAFTIFGTLAVILFSGADIGTAPTVLA